MFSVSPFPHFPISPFAHLPYATPCVCGTALWIRKRGEEHALFELWV